MAAITATFSQDPPQLRFGYMPSTNRYGWPPESGLVRQASTLSNAFSLRFDTVPAETPAPHRISETSSMRRAETPARYISMIASSTLVSRLR